MAYVVTLKYWPKVDMSKSKAAEQPDLEILNRMDHLAFTQTYNKFYKSSDEFSAVGNKENLQGEHKIPGKGFFFNLWRGKNRY